MGEECERKERWSSTTAVQPQLCQITLSHSVSSLYETLGRPWNWFNMSTITIINTAIPHMHTRTVHTMLENAVLRKQSSDKCQDEVTAQSSESIRKRWLCVTSGQNLCVSKVSKCHFKRNKSLQSESTSDPIVTWPWPLSAPVSIKTWAKVALEYLDLAT